MNKRSKQLGLAAIMIVVSWYGMMGVHEAGHCLGGLMTEGRIERVDCLASDGAGYEVVRYMIIVSELVGFDASKNIILPRGAGPRVGITVSA
jgi:hypothetical protein